MLNLWGQRVIIYKLVAAYTLKFTLLENAANPFISRGMVCLKDIEGKKKIVCEGDDM